MLFGLAPAIQTSKPDVVPVLKNEIIPAGTTHRGLRGFLALRQVLVVTQIALSLVSLVAAARIPAQPDARATHRHGVRDPSACWS